MKQRLLLQFFLLFFGTFLQAQASDKSYKDGLLFGIQNDDKILVPAAYSSMQFYGNATGPISLENRRWLVGHNNLYGIINSLGDTIVSIAYDQIDRYTPLVNEQQFFTVEKNGLKGLVNDSNQVVIPIEYLAINTTSSYILAKDTSRYTYFDETGKLLFYALPEPYHIALYAFKIFKSDSYFHFMRYHTGEPLFFKNVVSYKAINWIDIDAYSKRPNLFELTFEDGQKILLNTSSGEYLNLEASMQIMVNHVVNKSFVFVAEKEGKFGLINMKGETLLDFNYDALRFDYQAKLYGGGGRYVNEALPEIVMIASKNNKYGLIYADGKPKTEFSYEAIENINYHNDSNNPVYKVLQNGQYSLMSGSGEILVDEAFDYISSFGEAYAIAIKGNSVYLLDKYLDKQEIEVELNAGDGFNSLAEIKAALQKLLLSESEEELESFVRKITPSNYTMSFMSLTKLKALSYVRRKDKAIDSSAYKEDYAVAQNIEAFKKWLSKHEGQELAYFNDYVCNQSDDRLLNQCKNMKFEDAAPDLLCYLFQIDGQWVLFNPDQFQLYYKYNSFYK